MNISQIKTVLNNAVPEKKIAEIYSKADILYFVLDEQYNIVSCNVTAQEKCDVEIESVCGKNFLDLIPNAERDGMKKGLQSCAERGYLRDLRSSLIGEAKRPFEVEINGLSESLAADEPRIRLFIKDVRRLVCHERHRKASVTLSQSLSSGNFTETTLKSYLQTLLEVFHGQGVGILLINKGKSFSTGHWNPHEGVGFGLENFKKFDLAIFQDIIQTIRLLDSSLLSKTGILFLQNLDSLMPSLPAGKTKDCLISFGEYSQLLLAPIPWQNEIKGYLLLVGTGERDWTDLDVDFVAEVLKGLIQAAHGPQPAAAFDERAQSLMNAPIMGFLVVKNGNILSTNPWVENFLEVPANSLKGKPFLELIHPDHREAVSNLSKNSGGEQTHCDVMVLSRGKTKSIQCATNRIGLNGNSIEIWYWLDKEDRRYLQDQLNRSKKMEMLGMLAGGIVHDFNNLLASILGYSTMLREEFDRKNSHYEDVMQITMAAEKAVELTSRLLAHATGQSCVLPNLNVNTLVQEVAGILSRIIDKTITIRAELDPKAPLIKADASQIQQAILQIALSASEEMVNGGKLIFKTGSVELDSNQANRISDARPGRYLQIMVCDTAVSGSGKKGSTDPGNDAMNRNTALALVQKLVQDHHGFLSMFSEKSTGTVLKIHFPIVSEAQQSTETEKSKSLSGKETILLIDDERMLRETAQKMLTRYGYKVISAENSSQALSIYKKNLSKIDLVILDMLPGVAIHQVLAWIKQLNPKARIVAAAEMGEADSLDEKVQEGLSGIVRKPYRVRPLLQTVRSVLNA